MMSFTLGGTLSNEGSCLKIFGKSVSPVWLLKQE